MSSIVRKPIRCQHPSLKAGFTLKQILKIFGFSRSYLADLIKKRQFPAPLSPKPEHKGKNYWSRTAIKKLQKKYEEELEKGFYSLSEVRLRTGLGTETIKNYIVRGDFPAVYYSEVTFLPLGYEKRRVNLWIKYRDLGISLQSRFYIAKGAKDNLNWR